MQKTETTFMPVCISSNDSRGLLLVFFHTKRGRLFKGRRLLKGDDYFKYCSLEVVPKIFCFIISLNQKIITSNKLNILRAF